MLPENAAAMSALGAPRWSLFAFIQAANGPVRAWLGVGDFEVPADDVDTTGGTYLGVGLVGDIPGLSQLVGGVAERLDFVLSGTDERTFRLADEDAADVYGAPVSVGIAFFDASWQAVDPIAWLWEGTADVVDPQRSADDAGNIQRVVSLSVASVFTDRTRPQLGFYTSADQKRRSPTDTFCDRVALYGVDSTVQWPAPK